MTKFIKIIFLIGVFFLPLINSRITQLLGFSFGLPVNGNFEFTKVMFFNIWSSIVITLFFLKSFLAIYELKRITNVNMVLFLLYVLICFSTYFSISPYVSLLGNEIKGHSLLMWSNLIGLFLVLYNIYSKNFFKRTIQTFIFSAILVSVIGLKEYFVPSFDYGDLGNRLFSTFGHPNYLSIFLVSLMPFLYKYISNAKIIRRLIVGGVVLLFGVTLLLTKSILAILLFVFFSLYYFSKTHYGKLHSIQKIVVTSSIIFGFIIGTIVIFNVFPEKLHSFVSRFFIWETSIKIIFSDIKLFLVGGGMGTFIFHFDNFKSEYLYIFENLGFSADRPHNLILNFFYHFGVFGFLFILSLYYGIFKILIHTNKITPELTSLVLILLFLLLNFASVVLYLLIIILLVKIIIDYPSFFHIKLLNFFNHKTREFFTYVLLLFITLTSFLGAHLSYSFYVSETFNYKSNFVYAKNIYKYNPVNHFYDGDLLTGLKYSKIKTQEYYYAQIFFESNISKKILICDNYISDFNFVETYFFCGDTFWDLGQKENSIKYYKQGLELLPDLWNKDSQYYDNFLIKYFNITGNRFLSKRYGLAQILERVK